MGIPGLLKEFNILVGRDSHISIYRDKTVAVDASGWLHRSTYSCALDLVLSIPTTAYLSLLRAFLLLLLDHGVTPIIVFDGDHLPAKAATNAAREAHRQRHHQQALYHHQQHNTELATHHAQQAVQITPAMTAAFLSLCHSLSVTTIVAPFEADAQLAFLALHGHVAACITEDSDLIPFGVDRLFIRLTRDGAGREIIVSDLPLLPPSDPFIRRLKAVYLTGGLQSVCVLSGCDYLCSLKGMGVRTAVKWWDEWKCIEMIVGRMKRKRAEARGRHRGKKRTKRDNSNTNGKEGVEGDDVIEIDGDEEGEEEVQDEEIDVEGEEEKAGSDDDSGINRGKEGLYDGYALDFHKAVLTFQHQLVYDHTQQTYAYLTPLPPALHHLSTLPSSSSTSSSVSPPPPPSPLSITDSSLSLSSRLSLSHRHNSTITSLSFLGTPPPPHLAVPLANGELNPKTMRPYVVETAPIHSFFTARKGGEEEKKERMGGGSGGGWEWRRSEEEEQKGRIRLEEDRRMLEEMMLADGGAGEQKQEVERVDGDREDEGQTDANRFYSQSPALRRSNTTPVRSGGGRGNWNGGMKSRAVLEKERRQREEKRSTGGGLLRFFQKQ